MKKDICIRCEPDQVKRLDPEASKGDIIQAINALVDWKEKHECTNNQGTV